MARVKQSSRRAAEPAVIAESRVIHVYLLRDGLIARMDVEAPR